MAGYETAVVRLRRGMDEQAAGLGVLVGPNQVVTCAHVVNTALGREQRNQAPPGEQDVVLVDFPRLDEGAVRVAHVVAWLPPPKAGDGGGDVAGLVLTENAPGGAAAARFLAAVPEPGTSLRVFGYPGRPPRANGVHVDVTVKGEVGHRLLQVESRGDQSVKAQPGFSGSPVWDHVTGEVAGLLQVAPFADEPERDAYLLGPLAIAQAWGEPFDYLLVPENPYRGLESFTAKDASLFFGRDKDIGELASRVRRQPVTVVVGPSGVGKSSLVQAGLIPALQRDQRWSTVVIRPGQDLWMRLAAGLLRAEHGSDTQITRERCQREATRLQHDGLGPLARFLRSQDRPLLLVIDQFEELLAGDMSADQALLDVLLPPAGAAADAGRVVLTLRTDFLQVLQRVPGSHPRLNDRLYLLSPLTGGELRQAVEQPAAARGVGFEPGLLDLILQEATDTTLPVLQFALTRLWETQRGKTLTFARYHEMGGVRGALDRFAQDRASQLADASVEMVDRVLLRLVRTPAGNPELATRHRVVESHIPAAEWQVLQRLAGAWLVRLGTDPATGGSYAELAHEALITAWQRLASLVSQNAEFLNWLAWVQQRAADGDPLPDDRIAEARQWLTTRPGEIPAPVSRFVQGSETAAEARVRDLSEARDRAETAQQQAETAQRRAEALRIAADAELALHTAHPPLTIALALSTESVLTMLTPQGGLALRHALRIHPPTQARLDHGGAVRAVEFSPDGTRVATGSGDGSARVFDAVTGAELARLDHGGAVRAVVFSPDGTRVATGSGDGSARVFHAVTGAELARLDHGGPVASVAFSPDGTRVATGSGDASARVFHAATGAELARLDHGGPVASVAFRPDGTRVVTGSRDGSARVFHAVTGAELARLDHGGAVYAVAFSPDATRVATGSGDGSARVFDAVTGAELARLDHGGAVASVAFSPDGTRVATGSGDGSARVLDAATGAELGRLDHDGAVIAVAFSPDGTRVATGSGDESARVFHAATGAELARLDHDGHVYAVVFSPDGTRVATGSGDDAARVFAAVTGAELARLDHDGTVRAVVFSPEGTRVATGSGGGSARVFHAVTGAELARLDHDGDVHAVVFSPEGTRVATGSHDRSARVFHSVTGAELARLDHSGAVYAVAFSPDGTRVATGSHDGSARVFHATTGAELARLDHGGAVRAVAFSPDAIRVATGSGDRSARVFHAATGAELARLDHSGPVVSVAFSPDGTRVATGSHDGSARVLDAATGAELARLDHSGAVYAVAFSPDGTRVATGSGDGSARVLAAATGAELARLDHDGDVHAVAFSPDGTRVATGSYDDSARVFHAATGAELARLDHSGPVVSVAFSPDGTRVATGSRDRSARVFEAEVGPLIQRALHVMTRPLTTAELRRYSLPPDCRHVKLWNDR